MTIDDALSVLGPPERTVEWGVRMSLPGYPDDGKVLGFGDEAKARKNAYPECGDRVVSRTVERWTLLPDGSVVTRVSPWVSVVSA